MLWNYSAIVFGCQIAKSQCLGTKTQPKPAKTKEDCASIVSNTQLLSKYTHRIHGAAIYGNMDPINIPQMLAYIPYMDPMGYIMYSISKYWIPKETT